MFKKITTDNIADISIWIGALFVGVLAVLYAKIIIYVQELFFSIFSKSPFLLTIISPLVFVLAVYIVRKFGPDAKGSGIPQVLKAIEAGRNSNQDNFTWNSPLISIRTAIVKILSSTFGILGGASIGREGPTVQIAASTFAAFGRLVKKYSLNIELPSYLAAGAAAGVAAAFNTPLAGITFVIEEVLDGSFSAFKQSMMVAVILAGITAQAIIGDYLYFGRPAVSAPSIHLVYQAIVIGLVGGLLGGVFSRILAYPKLVRLPIHWIRRALICGIICSLLSYFTKGATAGSGYEVTSSALKNSTFESVKLMFPFYKMISTLLSYLSGMAGGIFSPSLSIGAGIGLSLAKLFHFANFRTCALIGMVAFFSGVVQAPLTAVIIVTEMTDRHVLILPFMIAAFVGQIIGKKLMPVPLYHFLAKRHLEG